MPIWVACVARTHVDRGSGAVTVEKDRDVEALEQAVSRWLGNFVAIHQLVTDAHHIRSLVQDVEGSAHSAVTVAVKQ